MKSEKLKVCVLEWGMRNSKSQGLKAKSKVEVEVETGPSQQFKKNISFVNRCSFIKTNQPTIKHITMRKSTRIIAWVLYLLGLAALILKLTHQDTDITLLYAAAILITVPWIICIVDYIKMESKKNYLWLYILIFTATIAIPVHLYKRRH